MNSPTLNQIRQIIGEENEKLRTEFKSGLLGVKSDLSGVKSDLSGVKSDLSGVKSDLSGVKSGLASLNKKVDKNHREVKTWFNDLDRGIFHVDQRLSRIEYHLGQPTPKFDPHAPIESVFINPIGK